MANKLYDHFRNSFVNGLHLAVTAASNATPIQVSTSPNNHNLVTGDFARVQQTLGNTATNGSWVITRINATDFTLNGSVGNGAYTAGTGVVTNGVDWLNDNIKAVLVDIRGGHYAVDLVNDRFLNPAIAAVDRLDALSGTTTTSPNLGTKTAVGGTYGAATTTLPLVAADTRPLGAIVLFLDTGAVTTSMLMGYWDTATGLPVTPNGGDIALAWAQVSPNVFKA